MKKLILTLIILATQTGCVCLRYTYEPAVNEVAKKGVIKRITNDYIEYETYTTNVVTTSVVKSTTYKAYYTSEGKIYKIKEK
jgi:hypothetical protein